MKKKKWKRRYEKEENGKGKVLTSLNRACPRCTQWTSPIPRCPSASSQTCHSSTNWQHCYQSMGRRPLKKRTRLDLPRKWRKCSEIPPETVSKEAIATANCEPTALVDWHKDRGGGSQGSWWLHVHSAGTVQCLPCMQLRHLAWVAFAAWSILLAHKHDKEASFSIKQHLRDPLHHFQAREVQQPGLCQAESQRRAKRPRTEKLPWD